MQTQAPQKELTTIIESARRLGVEVDEEAALQWLTAIAASGEASDVVVDTRAGVFGHRVTMLDFNPDDLAYFRKIGQLVEFVDEPGIVETALALSGSAAQSKIQSYPGDCDYFERVNIITPTREEACRILARLMRDKVLRTTKGPTYQFIEAKFGSYPYTVINKGITCNAGNPISWKPEDVHAGQIDVFLPDATPAVIRWDDVALDPGWCKLDWVVADPVRGKLSAASNMLDATWEAPDGTITPLDGYLDPYFQEVYLEAESIPIFSKLAAHVTANALDDYVEQLEREIAKYLTKSLNYGKAAKRMYNIFRLTGRYEEAAFLRELFDEPATVLYQVWSLVLTLDDAMKFGSDIPKEQLIAQADQLIMSVVDVLEGGQEAEIVRLLLRLRDRLSEPGSTPQTDAALEALRAEIINIVNNFFYDKLTALPTIKAYITQVEGQGKSH